MSIIATLATKVATDTAAKAAAQNRRDTARRDLAAANKAVRQARSALNRAKQTVLGSSRLDASWAGAQKTYSLMDEAKAALRAAKEAKDGFIKEGKFDLALTRVQKTLSQDCRAAMRQVLDLGVQDPTIVDQAMALVSRCSTAEKAGVEHIIEVMDGLENDILTKEGEVVRAGSAWHAEARRHARLRRKLLVEGTRREHRALKDAQNRVQGLVRQIKALNRQLGC